MRLGATVKAFFTDVALRFRIAIRTTPSHRRLRDSRSTSESPQTSVPFACKAYLQSDEEVRACEVLPTFTQTRYERRKLWQQLKGGGSLSGGVSVELNASKPFAADIANIAGLSGRARESKKDYH